MLSSNPTVGLSTPYEEVLAIFVQLALAVHYVHAQGILHRDLKAANVFLAPGGVAKLGDFGIARVLRGDGGGGGGRDGGDGGCGPSHANTVIGTPYYLSPEMCEGLPYDQKSDVWSMGCVLYELMTLRKAFDGSSLPALVLNIVRGEYPEPPRWGAGARPRMHASAERTRCDPYRSKGPDPTDPVSTTDPDPRFQAVSSVSSGFKRFRAVSSGIPSGFERFRKRFRAVS